MHEETGFGLFPSGTQEVVGRVERERLCARAIAVRHHLVLGTHDTRHDETQHARLLEFIAGAGDLHCMSGVSTLYVVYEYFASS